MSSWFDRFGYAEVADGLLVGAYPLDADDVGRLDSDGVEAVYNLCEDQEYAEGEREAVSAALEDASIPEQRVPLVDYGALPRERLERAVRDVAAALGEGLRVYLHCRAGWQRSAAVAAGVLAVREGLHPDDALEALQSKRPAAEPLDHQRADLLAWWESVRDEP
jgi:protein-tyrosine phosphatase